VVSNGGSVTSTTVSSSGDYCALTSGGSAITGQEMSSFLAFASRDHGLVAGGNAWPTANGWPSNTPWSDEFTSGASGGGGFGPDPIAFNHALFTNYVAAMPDSKPLAASIITPENQSGSVIGITAPNVIHHHG
jgi:hypothetical protein